MHLSLSHWSGGETAHTYTQCSMLVNSTGLLLLSIGSPPIKQITSSRTNKQFTICYLAPIPIMLSRITFFLLKLEFPTNICSERSISVSPQARTIQFARMMRLCRIKFKFKDGFPMMEKLIAFAIIPTNTLWLLPELQVEKYTYLVQKIAKNNKNSHHKWDFLVMIQKDMLSNGIQIRNGTYYLAAMEGKSVFGILIKKKIKEIP